MLTTLSYSASPTAMMTWSSHLLPHLYLAWFSGEYHQQATHTPVRVIITDIDDQEFQLTRPIEILIESDGDEMLAVFPEAELTRSGEYAHDALQWLKQSIPDLYRLLRDNEDTLGPLPKRQFQVLRERLGPKPNPPGRAPELRLSSEDDRDVRNRVRPI